MTLLLKGGIESVIKRRADREMKCFYKNSGDGVCNLREFSSYNFCSNCSYECKRLIRVYEKYKFELSSIEAGNKGKIGLSERDVALCELDGRLEYEYVMGLLEDEDLKGENWRDWGLRDSGHSKRIWVLWKKGIKNYM